MTQSIWSNKKIAKYREGAFYYLSRGGDLMKPLTVAMLALVVAGGAPQVFGPHAEMKVRVKSSSNCPVII